MAKTIGVAVPVSMLVCLALAATVAAGGSFYKDIQKGVASPIPDREFEKLESAALKDFTNSELQRQLALAFAPTSEKIWAIIYGEASCALASSDEAPREMGAKLFSVYDAALAVTDNGASVSMCTLASSASLGPAFEANYEISFLIGTTPFMMTSTLKPLTIGGLAQVRQEQLRLWKEKKLPETQLFTWLSQIVAAGHFETYNFWLFQDARPREFEAWKASNPSLLGPWLEWLKAHPFHPDKPDYHRIYAK